MSGSSEETPLLEESSSDPAILKHEQLYNRFSPPQKRVIVALVSWAGFIPLLVAASFIPSIPQIALDFGSTGSIISLAVSLSLSCAAIGSMIWATYSSTYGRRPIYLASLPCLCIGSVGVATSKAVPELMLWRIFQQFGASSGMSVGASVIGDIYKLEERGTAMGIFYGASLCGPAIAPLAGGLATHYATWRHAQWALFIAGLCAFVPIYLFLPETLDPERMITNQSSEGESKRKWVWLNPFAGLAMLRSPNLMAMTLTSACVLLTDYVLMVPLSYTIGKQYNISNEAVIGAFFLPAGIGNIIGAPLAGRMSDRIVVKWRKRRGGKWVPEDRLRAALFGGLVFVPFSVLLSGLTTQFVKGPVGIVLNLACLFMNGIGVDIVLTPVSSYFVDVMHLRSAEIIAAVTAVRSLFVALATACVLPLINKIGVAATDAISAAIAWIGFFLIWLTIRYGDRMRAWVDTSQIGCKYQNFMSTDDLRNLDRVKIHTWFPPQEQGPSRIVLVRGCTISASARQITDKSPSRRNSTHVAPSIQVAEKSDTSITFISTKMRFRLARLIFDRDRIPIYPPVDPQRNGEFCVRDENTSEYGHERHLMTTAGGAAAFSKSIYGVLRLQNFRSSYGRMNESKTPVPYIHAEI
ncbi:MFS antiporter QDR3 [Grifola frondosa]|uniref:MFS antiporter QDR3 n=1 Tax=Grifola frondosa TaxID=5627 RepID=A0A1C7MDQ7_GRIFR|nr:MFS antiporter QDR3 [Grifola frondosa]